MHRELLLLGVLRQGNMHGYGINEFIQRDMAYCTDLKKPTAYHLLKKMADAGWIQERMDQEGKRPPRRTYTVTAEGEAAFQRLLRENLRAYASPRFEGDIGIAFVDQLPIAEALTLLRERQTILQAELETLEQMAGHGEGGMQLILLHQKRYLGFELEWLAEVMTHLSESAKE